MSNFTKSIVYSGVVLAAGLVAIFAIYNNMTEDGANYASIEPAAGQIGEGFTDTYEGVQSSIENAASDAAEAASSAYDATTEAAGNAADAVSETASDAANATTEAYEEAKDAVKDATTTSPSEKAAEAVEETGEAIEEAAENAKEAAEDAVSQEPAAGDVADDVINKAKETLGQ